MYLPIFLPTIGLFKLYLSRKWAEGINEQVYYIILYYEVDNRVLMTTFGGGGGNTFLDINLLYIICSGYRSKIYLFVAQHVIHIETHLYVNCIIIFSQV